MMRMHALRCAVPVTLGTVMALVSPALATPAGEQAWRFRVLLDRQEIGQHDFILRAGPQGRELTSRARYRVKVLFVEAYRYTHDSTERFADGCLTSIDATTDDNGTPWQVSGRRTDGVTLVTVGDERRQLRDCVLTFAYWDPAMLARDRLLNAQTGEYQEVKIAPLGPDTIDTPAGRVPANRWRLTGRDLHIDLWYSSTSERQWLGLESRTPGGRVIRYVLR